MRTFITFNIALLSLSFIFSSCYSMLRVKVDALDMKKLYESSEYKEANQKIELESYSRWLNSNYFSELTTSILKEVESALDKDPKISEASVAPALEDISSDLANHLQPVQSSMESLRSALQNLMTSATQASHAAYAEQLANYLNRKDAFAAYLTTLLSQAGVTDQSALTEFHQFSQGVVQTIPTMGIYGVRITDDKLASFVAKVPEPYWMKYKTSFYTDPNNAIKSDIHRSRINETKISTFIGNSDIAVKMDGPGNFVIKGVRLDADQAFRTSFKVLSQSIQHFAKNNKLLTAPAESGVSSGLNDYATNLATVKRLQQEQVTGTKIFLEVLSTYKDDLQSTDAAKRAHAVKMLKAAYDFYQSHLTQP